MIFLATESTNQFLLFFGRMHPLIVHLPIGILLMAVLFEIASRFYKIEELQKAISFTLFCGFLSAILACGVGYLLKLGGGYDEELLTEHQNQGIAVAVLSLLAWWLKSSDVKPSQSLLKKAYLPVLGLTTLLLFVAGHHGGALTHGEDFLSQPLMSALGMADEQTIAKRKPIANVEEALVFQDVVQPILNEKCIQCHNAKKQKGDLRLDSQAAIEKGGENGAIILANKPDESKLYEYLTRPEGDDKHMPPKGKPQPTENDITLIHWWIQNGAAFDKKVAQLPKDDKIKPVLIALATGSSGEMSSLQISDIPAEKIAEADKNAIEALRKFNVLVMPVSNDQNYLMVNCVNASSFSDKEAMQLATLSKQLVWLKMGNTQISDNALKEIGKLETLTRLSLEHTNISDIGLANLKGLKNLQYLNLFGTKVTDKGLEALKALKSLRSVYLYQTQVTPAAAEALKKALPNTQIDIGGYMTQSLPTDTTVYKAEVKKGK